MYMAHTFIVHTSLHWMDRGVGDLTLWSFAIKHGAWLHNWWLPNWLAELSIITNWAVIQGQIQSSRLALLACMGIPGFCAENQAFGHRSIRNFLSGTDNKEWGNSWFFKWAFFTCCKRQQPHHRIYITSVSPCFWWFVWNSNLSGR